MADTDGDLHRSLHTHRPDEVSFRDADDVDADEGMMEIRLPIASSGEVRNEGDDPLSTAELQGMAQQVDSLTRGVFPEHGESDKIDFAGYSQFEKLGYWADADLQREASTDDEDLLVATARMPDPETLPAATGDYREALAILKEQAIRGIPITSSIGWREDEDAPGGNDLMEVSVVGIGADPRAGSEGGEALLARAAVRAGADPDALVETVREIAREEGASIRDLTGKQADQAIDLLKRFIDAQGEASVRNFENWLWEIDDDDADDDAIHAAHSALEEFFRANSPMDEAVTDSFKSWLNDQRDSDAGDPEDTNDMTDDDTDTDDEPDVTTEQALATLADREVSADALVPILAEVTGADEEAAEAAIEDLQADDEDGDDEEDEDEEDDDEDQSAADPDEEQSADEADEQQSTDPELAERLDAIEEGLDAIREGEVDLDTPDADEGEDEEETRDTTDDETDPADAPAWASEI